MRDVQARRAGGKGLDLERASVMLHPMRCALLLAAICRIGDCQPSPRLSFEVASVKLAASLSNSGPPTIRGGPGTSDPERIVFTNVTLRGILQRAYTAKSYQITGPAWLASSRYDIAAKVPLGTSTEQCNSMLQRLLADRFHLALHHETKQLHGYELVRGSGALKLKRSSEAGPDVVPAEAPKTDSNGFPRLSAPGLVIMEGLQGTAVVSFVTARAQRVSALAELLSKEFRLPVTDETGLTGKFDFTLEFAPQAPGAVPIESPDGSAANLISAIPQQLGLKLVPMNVPVDVLIVDSGDKIPIEN
jgi:uncharacterized protein (TIGR03435 family)